MPREYCSSLPARDGERDYFDASSLFQKEHRVLHGVVVEVGKDDVVTGLELVVTGYKVLQGLGAAPSEGDLIHVGIDQLGYGSADLVQLHWQRFIRHDATDKGDISLIHVG